MNHTELDLIVETAGVYCIKNKLDNKRYIGSSMNLRRRLKAHMYALIANRHHSSYLQRAWNKYGQQNFLVEILEECDQVLDTLLFLEQKYLDLKPEYNTLESAYSFIGFKLSEESRNKIGTANKNRIWKDESRKKISESTKKLKHIIALKIKVIGFNENEEIEFESISDAAKYTGHINHRTSIKDCLKQKQNTAYGYKWKYKNDIKIYNK